MLSARVASVSYEELVKAKDFEPLGLNNTGFSEAALKHFSNYAPPYDTTSFKDAKKGSFVPGELYEDYLKDAPAGDIYSNMLDLQNVNKAALTENFVSLHPGRALGPAQDPGLDSLEYRPRRLRRSTPAWKMAVKGKFPEKIENQPSPRSCLEG
ncbi:hypothetical protein BGZ47_000223, partial [Haplosporangium gracile]